VKRTRLVNARIWNGIDDGYAPSSSVTIADGRIVAMGDHGPVDTEVDLGGKALLPGFIDAHFHAYAAMVDTPALERLPLSYLAHHATRLMADALHRGFTTVRDAGGADWGLAQALAEGLIPGPRLFRSGRALSQTGGHGDSRTHRGEPCSCGTIGNLSRVVDGVEAVRLAARETLAGGAEQIKIFVSGGISSPSDPIAMRQYSGSEIRAIVAEARSRQTYVMAHAYTADAIIHAVRNGVRSIEHGNLLDEAAADAMARAGAFLVPTLVAYEALSAEGVQYGLSAVSAAKIADVAGRGAEAVRIARAAGVAIGFGTDLLGGLHPWQLHEFRLRGVIEVPVDVLRSATSENAKLLNRNGELGVIALGAHADFVVVDGDPLHDLSAIWDGGIAQVWQAGMRVS
jgi:imidazolonepropionase-like amidohydrolase